MLSGIILPTAEENSGRCLVQECQKHSGKILKGKFATNLRKHKRQETKPEELTEQEERARHLHHNCNKQ